jgi:hypothetical protein
MRDEAATMPSLRLAAGIVLAALGFIAAHATLIVAGKAVSWSSAIGFAGVSALLWFAAAPLLMLAGRRVANQRRGVAWQLALGLAAAPLFGCVQGFVAAALALRSAMPPRASAFYYLDLNVAVLVLSALALDVYARRAALARHTRSYLALEARMLEVRHDVLTLQLQPHFLFNALNSVVELIREAPADAMRTLRDLRTVFLATTQRTSSAAVSLEDELDVVDAFVNVARVRYADRFAFRRDVEAQALAASVPPLSLQPLVENAIRFALAAEGEHRFVTLTADVGDGRLRVRVINSCTPSDRSSAGLGIGLRNTRERLAHLFDGDHSLTLAIAPAQATASLEVPFVPIATMLADRARMEPRLPETPSQTGQLTHHSLPATPGDRPLFALRVVGFWMLVWLFWVFQMHFYREALGLTSIKSPFASGVADLLSAISWMALTPLALFLGRRLPVRGPRASLVAFAHIVGALACSAANLGFIWLFHGLASIPINNVLNQLVVNCAIYSLLVVWTHGAQIARWFDERQTATRRLEARIARARWNAMEMQLQPEWIAGHLERLERLVASDPARAEDGVLDMADSLRRLLQGTDRHSSATPTPVSLPAATRHTLSPVRE